MLRSKLWVLAIVGLLGIAGIKETVLAAETNNNEIISENLQNDKKAAFEGKIKKAKEKWNGLSSEQKDEVYSHLEDNLEDEFELMDELVELGVFEREDVSFMKKHKMDELQKLRESGEFPFFRHKHSKSK